MKKWALKFIFLLTMKGNSLELSLCRAKAMVVRRRDEAGKKYFQIWRFAAFSQATPAIWFIVW